VDGSWLPAFRDRYCALLEEEIVGPAPGKCLMPGVRDALQALDGRPDVALGLVTGNFAEGARIKLGHFDLAHYFGFGAFADDAVDRNALVPIALARAAERGLRAVSPDRVSLVAIRRPTWPARSRGRPRGRCRDRAVRHGRARGQRRARGARGSQRPRSVSLGDRVVARRIAEAPGSRTPLRTLILKDLRVFEFCRSSDSYPLPW